MSARPSSRSRQFATPAVALMFGLTLLLAGCGSDGDGTRTAPEEKVTATPGTPATTAPTATATATPAGTDAKTIQVTIAGEKITPNGIVVKVKANQKIVLEISSDRAGELHVHSAPEKQIEFPAGKSQVTLKFEQPGVVDVEEHDLDKLIVQLEVR